jgi:hypothetical protein
LQLEEEQQKGMQLWAKQEEVQLQRYGPAFNASEFLRAKCLPKHATKPKT